MTSQPALARRLGLGDAVLIGLGSMIGAGVFAAFAPAAQAAGSGLLIGLAVAAVVAFCNATASAQLAAQYPTSGGTYVYGRERLGAWWGYLAGWSFVVGKTASCAAMAITFAAYAAPAGWEKPVAVAAVLALGGVNALGVTRTALLTRILVSVVLVALAIAVAAGASTGLPGLGSAFGGDSPAGGSNGLAGALLADGWYGVLQSAGLLFFAFAGYARIATMGEEVRDPARTIPRAIVLAFGAVVVIYGVVAVVLLGVLGPDGVAASSAPVADAVAASGWSWAGPVVRVGAAAASLGALLALIAGVGRTSLAMAREGDLPRWLAVVHPRFLVPQRAELVLAVIVSVLVLLTDLRGAIAFSSFGVLLYYAIANLSALTQPREQRRYPRGLQVLGVVGCVGLGVTLPMWGVVAGAIVVIVGVALRVVRLVLARDAMDAVSTSMKALRAHARGGPEQLVYEDAPVPEAPKGSDVCVQVTSAALTFDELTWAETWEADGIDRTPTIPSHEFAGVVVAVGPDAEGVAVGDEVFGLVPFDRDGAAAEFVLTPATSVVAKPAGVSDVEAAAAVLPALTAMEALDDAMGLTAGQRLLVRGGTGGVGAFVTQFAHRMGLSVTVTVRSSAGVERAKRLGADEVLVGDQADGIPAASFDGSIDAVGAGTPEWLYRSVRPGGRVITLQESPDADLARKFAVDAHFFLVEPRADALRRLAAELAGGDIEVAVAQVYPLAEGRAAYENRGRSGKPGKTVLDVGLPKA